MFYNLCAKEVTPRAQGQTYAAHYPISKTKAVPAVVYSLVQRLGHLEKGFRPLLFASSNTFPEGDKARCTFRALVPTEVTEWVCGALK